jgi:hypothetical protein
MRSGKLIAANDYLIEEFLQDSRYLVTSEGRIYRNGKQLGRYDKEGYIEIYYKGKRLKAHRIVYAKFKGKLSKDLVIEHDNGETYDNNPSNLLLVSQKKNCEYRVRRQERGNTRKRRKVA